MSNERSLIEKMSAREDKPVLLIVSFGTSHNDNRSETIEAVERRLAEANPEYEPRRAFTSRLIASKLRKRDQEHVDNVTQALYRCLADGVKEVLIITTFVLPAFEYHDVLEEIRPFAQVFKKLSISAPLLFEDADFTATREVLVEESAGRNEQDIAYVYMGHGTTHEANSAYRKLQDSFRQAGYENFFVGAVEGEPYIDEVLASVKARNYKKIVLLPLMIVAGEHAKNDMAGDEEHTWHTRFKAEGYEVECRLEGLGSYPGISEIFLEHASKAVTV